MAVVGSIEAGGAICAPLEDDLAAWLTKADAQGLAFGFEVHSDDLGPRLEPGDVIFFGHPVEVTCPDLTGSYAACRLASGETVLARLEQGQEVVWAAPVVAIIPSRASVRGNA